MTVVLGSSLFVLVKGDRPERLGALLQISVALLGIPVIYALRAVGLPKPFASALTDLFISTGLVSFGFLYIALRYASNWLALAMVVQGLEFYIDRVLLDSDVDLSSYALQENLITAGVSLVLFLASMASIDKRRKKRQAEALRAQKDAERRARTEAMLAGRMSAAT